MRTGTQETTYIVVENGGKSVPPVACVRLEILHEDLALCAFFVTAFQFLLLFVAQVDLLFVAHIGPMLVVIFLRL